jgi:alpha-galactosidase
MRIMPYIKELLPVKSLYLLNQKKDTCGLFFKNLLSAILLFLSFYAGAQAGSIKNAPSNSYFTLSWAPQKIASITYTIKKSNQQFVINLPSFEIDGKTIPAVLTGLAPMSTADKLKNGVTSYTYEGAFIGRNDLRLSIRFQVAPDNPVLRFQYILRSNGQLKLTKNNQKDNLKYLSFTASSPEVKEVRLSEFNERFHATNKTEYVFDNRYFSNQSSFMGPIAVTRNGGNTVLVAYEHGSQYPDRFLEFVLNENRNISVQAVKGNYLANQEANGFESVWFNIAGINGNEDQLAENYRDFVLKYITENSESRKPYIFYNTWGRQERVQWTGQKYLSSMNLDQTLKEIDRAHAMGIEVFVIDAGWFKKTGDWEVNKQFFPDELKQVKAKIDGYGMKLGLWFNPTVAALSSSMYKNNLVNRMSRNGNYGEAREIWETEESVGMCLVSAYWEDFANKLITLTKELGVSYFKWDAIGQYGCNDAHHLHGTEQNSMEERTQRYAFLQPLYMTKIIDKVCKEAPQSIFDFDITEDGRCVGLQFLSAGKYFIINNGPYYHNFDLAPMWKSVLPNTNANIFVEPGPARGWFVRSVLDYDKWIPSVLFLTHYQPDEPRNSQIINIGSLILGQNGIWGEVLKTSDKGVQLFDSVLSRYKTIRDDITAAQMVKSGEPGGSPEIYEKINSKTGKGCVVIFASAHGSYTYVTQHKTDLQNWHNEEVEIHRDKQGRSVITTKFHEPSVKIILFGVQ